MQLITGPQAARKTEPLALLDGLLSLEELPAGRTVWTRSAAPLEGAKATFALVDGAGQPVPLLVNGQARERVSLTLSPAPPP